LHALIGEDFFRTPYAVILPQGSDLSPLAAAAELRNLTVSSDDVEDLSPLVNLGRLTKLTVVSDRLRDLSPLAKLTELDRLVLSGKQIRDLSPISGLSKLEELVVISETASDLSPLTSLTNLKSLFLCAQAIPSADVAELQRVLPACKITCGPIELRQSYRAYDEQPQSPALRESAKPQVEDCNSASEHTDAIPQSPRIQVGANSSQQEQTTKQRMEAFREFQRSSHPK
jgi:Leucine-rich repeat (LRR) protein